MTRRELLMFGLCAAALTTLPACKPAQSKDDLDKLVSAALSDPGRAAQQKADERRKPFPLIRLSGMKPGDKVLDLIPGDGYWTRIFSKIVGPQGKVYAVWPRSYARYSMGNVATLRSLSGSKNYPNVTTLVEKSTVLQSPEPLDVVWTSQNYHDYPDEFMGRTDTSVLNKAVFAMLKPGGVFMIIDHRAAAGRGVQDTEALHRIDPETVKQQVTAAGFIFEGESNVLNNPADPLNIAVFDASIRGRTSQFAFKFRKPT